MGAVPGGDALLSAYDAAVKEFLAGRPVPVDENLPEGLRQVIQGITQPATNLLPENCGFLIRQKSWPRSPFQS